MPDPDQPLHPRERRWAKFDDVPWVDLFAVVAALVMFTGMVVTVALAAFGVIG